MTSSIITACALGLMLALSGCANSQPEQPPVEASTAEATPEAPLTSPPAQPHPDGGLVVADARMYRGVVENLSESQGAYTMTLRQAQGTDFGHTTLEIRLDADANTSFPAADLQNGDYLEIYYGGAEAPVSVIAANRLPNAEDCIYNGEFVELQKGTGGHMEGALVLRHPDTGDITVFEYADTQFYITGGVEAIQPGDLLNIYHQGTVIDSRPPRGLALEVRPYSPGEEE